jgi:hypothetical protein
METSPSSLQTPLSELDLSKFTDRITRNIDNQTITFEVKGIFFYKTNFIGPLRLEKDPNNKYDPFAIKVINGDGNQIGWVPKTISYHLTQQFHTLSTEGHCHVESSRSVLATFRYSSLLIDRSLNRFLNL